MNLPPPSDSLTATCPLCGTRGPSVELGTVKAILTESALRRIECVSHRFCETAECPVVYYGEAGATFERRDVRVRVWQKEPFGDRPACYCFGETEATIREEFMRKGSSDAIERVRAHIKADRCACDVRNPRGLCCLGDLEEAVRRVGDEMPADRSTP